MRMFIFSFPVGIDLQKPDSSMPSYIDLQAETGRVVTPLPGPRDDAAYPSYRLILRASQPITPQDNSIQIQLKGEQNQSKIIPLIANSPQESSKTKKTANYYLYGISSLGQVSSRD